MEHVNQRERIFSGVVFIGVPYESLQTEILYFINKDKPFGDAIADPLDLYSDFNELVMFFLGGREKFVSASEHLLKRKFSREILAYAREDLRGPPGQYEEPSPRHEESRTRFDERRNSFMSDPRFPIPYDQGFPKRKFPDELEQNKYHRDERSQRPPSRFH